MFDQLPKGFRENYASKADRADQKPGKMSFHFLPEYADYVNPQCSLIRSTFRISFIR